MDNPTSRSEARAERISRRALVQGSMMAAAIPLCCTTPQAPAAGVSFKRGLVLLDIAVCGLRKPGAACAVVDPVRQLNILVARVDQATAAALDRTCTHGGAQCTYNPRRKTLRCTSLNHAEYDLNGTLLHGRTHGNLKAYPARIAGGRIEVIVGEAQA